MKVKPKRYFDYGEKATDLQLNSLELRLKKEYAQASREVTAKMNKHLNDFYRKDNHRRSLVAKGEWTQEDYIQWRQGQLYIAGRWSELSNSIAQDYINVNKIASSMITDHNYDVYALNHNYGAFQIDNQVNTGISWTLYDRNAVKNLAKGNKDLPLKTVMNIPKDLQWNKRHIESAMMQGILQGESIDKIAKRLPKAVGETNLNGAIRRARTLTTYAQNVGRLDSFKEAQALGVNMKKCWLAVLDSRTRDSHARLHGEKADIDDTFSNGLMCPGDPNGPASEVYNCRCDMIAQIKGHEISLNPATEKDLEGEEKRFEEWQDAFKLTETEVRNTYNSVMDRINSAIDNGDFDKAQELYTNNSNVIAKFNKVQAERKEHEKLKYAYDLHKKGLATQEEVYSSLPKAWLNSWDAIYDDTIRNSLTARLGNWSTTGYKEMKHDYLLEEMLSKSSLKPSTTLYRGLSLDDELLGNIKPGVQFIQDGLASWSTNNVSALEFATTNKNPVLLIDKSKRQTAVPIADFSIRVNENEVLSSGKNRFTVISKKTTTIKYKDDNDTLKERLVTVIEVIANK